MTAFSATTWAARQRELDAARVGDAALLAHKVDRMAPSPLALLRGSAPLFYELLAAWPSLAEGPSATGWMVGDLHIENFGAYRPSALTAAEEGEDRVVFDLNDFDDATVGPVHLDALRLCTSLLLGTRDLGLPGRRRAELGAALLEAWGAALVGDQVAPPPPQCIQELLDRVRHRNRKALLDARTEIVGHHRRFVRGPRYRDLPPSVASAVVPAFATYIASLPVDARPQPDALEVIDCAFRVAGTGSLGSLRVAVLTRGKGGLDGGFVFDLKAQGEPSANALFAGPALGPVARVRGAAHALLGHPPRMLGETVLEGRSCLGRRLSPQEDRLDWETVAGRELLALAKHLGWLAGRAHRRGLTAPLSIAPSIDDRAHILGHASTLAGLHEAIYLAL